MDHHGNIRSLSPEKGKMEPAVQRSFCRRVGEVGRLRMRRRSWCLSEVKEKEGRETLLNSISASV